MTNKQQEALEALNNIESYYNSAISNPPYQEELDIIREALSRPQVDVGALAAECQKKIWSDAPQNAIISTQQAVKVTIDHLVSEGYLSPPSNTVVDWQPTLVEEPDGLHHNPSAKDWAEYFVTVYPQHKHMEDVMLGWFANAMMAMYDSQPSDIDKCPRCGGYTDNGFSRDVPPSPYFCTKCMEETYDR